MRRKTARQGSPFSAKKIPEPDPSEQVLYATKSFTYVVDRERIPETAYGTRLVELGHIRPPIAILRARIRRLVVPPQREKSMVNLEGAPESTRYHDNMRQHGGGERYLTQERSTDDGVGGSSPLFHHKTCRIEFMGGHHRGESSPFLLFFPESRTCGHQHPPPG